MDEVFTVAVRAAANGSKILLKISWSVIVNVPFSRIPGSSTKPPCSSVMTYDFIVFSTIKDLCPTIVKTEEKASKINDS